MSKYIDAEKLKSVIKAQINQRENWMKDVDKSDRQEQLWSDLNGEDMSIIQIINSLQQERPELLGYDKALLEVKGKVDELYEKTSIGLNEYDSGLYNGIAETCTKLRGFIKARLDSYEQPESTCKTCGFYENNCPFIRGKLIPYPNRGCKDYTYSVMKEQEQPEVDLEEYIENEIKHYGLSLYEPSYGTFSASEIDRIMRKFYELGLKARKEETK